MLDYDEAGVMAASWLTEFKRKHVPAELYEDLMQKAFDGRVSDQQEGRTPPPFDLTLLLSTFRGFYIVEFQEYCDECLEDYGYIDDPSMKDEIFGPGKRKCTHENYPLGPPKIKRR